MPGANRTSDLPFARVELSTGLRPLICLVSANFTYNKALLGRPRWRLYICVIKLLWQDYAFVKWFYKKLQNFQIRFMYYYHYFIITLQVEFWIMTSKHLKFSLIFGIWAIGKLRHLKYYLSYIFVEFFKYYLRYL